MSMDVAGMLHRAGVIDEIQHRSLMQRTEQWGGNVLLMLVRSNMMAEEELVRRLSDRFGHEAEYPLPMLIEAEVLSTLPGDFCVANLALPLRELPDGRLQVAVANPSDLALLDLLRTTTSRDVSVVGSGPVALHDAIRFQYFGEAVQADDGTTGGLDTFGAADATRTTTGPPLPVTPVKEPEIVDIGDLFGGSAKGTPAAQRRPEPELELKVETIVALEQVVSEPAQAPGPTVGIPASSTDEDVHGQSIEAQLLQVQVLCRELSSELRELLDLLVDKGVFTRDEYKAWRNSKRS